MPSSGHTHTSTHTLSRGMWGEEEEFPPSPISWPIVVIWREDKFCKLQRLTDWLIEGLKDWWAWLNAHLSFIVSFIVSYIVLHCLTLSYIVLYCLTLSCIVLHWLTLSYIVLHCLTLWGGPEKMSGVEMATRKPLLICIGEKNNLFMEWVKFYHF